ncbi:glycosyltransferase family 9 protein [Chitinophaga japonensis]|uniref:ADP-heptose:LPS heptosyltransferase n=1 Tax=Chitinophaga japonensis TaxID=104662 RepID=A0A562T1A2_CHIJA|nr:glycosyltransferase family 9 protein [Chitinophaga japonensis]TWI86978.1 ADP-heptose:LPS heptosyltransferase [Chitinophaga japonensis]
MKKIAVLRANALGDFIFALPALSALRETFPDHEIVYLGKKMHRDFLCGRPGPVDRVIVVPPYPGVGEAENYEPDPEQVNAFFRQMREEQFDIAIQMHGGGGFSNPFLQQLGAGQTVGLQAPDAPPLDISIPYIIYYSEILRYLEVVSYLGATTRNLVPVVNIMEKDIREARQVMQPHDGSPVAVIHPGATDPRRHWPAVNFARVADYLVSAGYTVYINGLPEEAYLVNGILQNMQQRSGAHSLCGKLSICGLAGLLSLADIVVSNDSGPLHLAYALRIPAVGIYWVGNMITGTPMTSAINRPLISWTTRCPLCGLEASRLKSGISECRHHASFVADVSVDDVLQAVQDLTGAAYKLKAVV